MTLRALTRARALVSLLVVALLAVVVVPLSSTTAAAATGTVTGTVFNDYDTDGVIDGGEPGIQGVVVSAYSNTGLLGTATSNASGVYTISSFSTTATPETIRIEMQSWPAGYEPTRYGSTTASTNQTTVRFHSFVNGSNANINFGLQEPSEFCQTNPGIAVTAFCGGDPLLTGIANGEFSVFEANYASSTRTGVGLVQNTGSVNGVAWDPVNARVYTAAYVKRHAGLGSNGIGAVYSMDPATNTTAFWVNVTSLGIDLGQNNYNGTNPFPTNAARGLAANSVYSEDPIFDEVGKYGIGDIDTNDVDTLYLTNLYGRTVHALPIPAGGGAPTSQTSLGLPESAVTCTAGTGTARPFAITYKDGYVYAGVVCDAATGTTAALDAYVVRTPATGAGSGTWAQYGPRIDLDYDKGPVFSSANSSVTFANNRWNIWDPTFDNSWDPGTSGSTHSGGTRNDDYIFRPTPMLSDIEFDDDGSLILAFRDRTTDQLGSFNAPPNAEDSQGTYPFANTTSISNPRLVHGMSGGDILRVCNVSGTWVVDGATSSCPNHNESGAVSNNNQGPNGGEFYAGDTNGSHTEISFGHLALAPRTGQVLLSSLNAEDGTVNSGGVRGLSNSTGQRIDSISANYYVANDRPSAGGARFAKSNGMGDLEVLCDAAPLEIGNRIWEDTDQDGIQDPNEPGINGVTVQLLNSGGTVVGTAVTSGTGVDAGQYYFRTGLSEVAGGNGDNIGGGLALRQSFSIRVGIAANYTGVGPLAGMILTTPDATPSYTYAGDPDTIDSNPTAGVGVIGTAWFPTMAVGATTTLPGLMDHTYDVGFYDAPIIPSRDLALRKTVTSMSGTPASGTVTFQIEIFNQTADAVEDVTITDYIDTASFLPMTTANASGTTGGAASLPYSWNISSTTNPTVTIDGIIPGNSSVTLPVTLAIANPVRMAGLRNYAEITVFDTDGNSGNGTSATGAVYDVDSIPDATNSDTLLDDSINLQRWTNTATTQTENTGVADEDDHDIATVPVWDLALIKTRAGGQASTIINGATTANFTITVKNQGQNTAYGITVLDQPDAPMTRSTSTAASQNVTTSPSSTAVTVTYNSGTGVFTIPVLAPGESVSFTAITNVAEAYGVQVNRAEITAFDNDSTTGNPKPTWVQDMDSIPDSTIGNDALQQNGVTFPIDSHNNVDNAPVNGNNALDEDDHDAEGVELGLLRIGSTVYKDADADSVGDAGEEVAGVRVQLFRYNGSTYDLVGTTVTNANGDYSFDQLRPGTYQVGIPTDQTTPANSAALTNWEPVPGSVANPETDNFDNDGDAETGFLSRSDNIVLTYNGEPTNDDADDADADALTSPRTYTDTNSNLNIDFVFRQITYQLGNLVWLDTGAGANYGNGVANSDESGISGVTVQLFAAADTSFTTVLQSTTTVAGGYYNFTGLAAGSYVVRIPTSTLPVGYVTAGTPVTAGGEIDNDNNANVGTGGWNSGTVVLGPGSPEPTGEADGTTGADAQPTETVADNRANQTVDFAFVPTVRVGNQVWRDQSDNDPVTQVSTDNNGVFNTGERGLAGVTVQLWIDVNTNGTFERGGADGSSPYMTTTTNSEGNYWFNGVRPGRAYFVVIPSIGSLVGATPSSSDGQSASATTADNDDDGAPVGSDIAVSRAFTPAVGTAPTGEADAVEPGDGTSTADATAEIEANLAGLSYADNNSQLRIDFGFIDVPVYRLGNLVWLDNGGSPYVAADERDGVADVNEPGVAGVTVQLMDSTLTTVLDTAVTDANGKYAFENLVAGDYRVRILTASGTNSTILANLVSTTDGAAANSDTDNDDNGVVATGGWASSTVSLGAANPYMGAEPTNEVLRSGSATDDDNGASWTASGTDPAFYNDNRSNFSVDFGFAAQYRIGNLVWNDLDNDGLAESGEPALTGVTVELWSNADGDGVLEGGELVGTTSTNGSGFYEFTALAPGAYIVYLPGTGIPAGYVPGGTPVAAGNDVDNDNNANVSGGGFASGSVTLGNSAEPTNEVNRVGGGDDDTAGYPDNRSNYSVDFGFVGLYRIGNLVWLDSDNDGLAETGEPALSGVTVELYSNTDGDGLFEPSEELASTTTNASGFYSFSGLLAGDYIVHIPGSGLPSNVVTSGTPTGANNDVDNDNNGTPDFLNGGHSSGSVTLGGDAEPTNEINRVGGGDDDTGFADNRSNYSVDFGFTPLYRIGNLVWHDLDNDGLAEAGEPAISGVTVQLWRNTDGDATFEGGELVSTAITDGAGFYSFSNLVPGDYIVHLPGTGIPTDYTVGGTPVAAGNDVDNDNNANEDAGNGGFSSGNVTLGSEAEPTNEVNRVGGADDDNGGYADNRSNYSVDFGFVGLYRIGNLVWNDVDNDGLAESGEPALDGVTVQLRDTSNNVLQTTSTNASGFYSFVGLTAGDYEVYLPGAGIPAGYVAGGTPVGANNDVDNDNNANASGGGYSSGTVTLGSDAEPDNEVARIGGGDDDTAGYPDTRSNYSVDFGFTAPPEERDLALVKTVIGVDPELEWDGGSVMFGITVTNQGTESVEGITVVDYIDGDYFDDLDLTAPQSGSATDNAGVPVIHNYAWENSDADKPTAYIDGVLAPGASVTIPLVLDVNIADFAQAIANGLVNFAEISEFDTDGDYSNGSSSDGSVFDTDSIPDTTDDDTFVTDDDVSGEAYQNTNSSPGPYDEDEDEDDHDRATVPLYDLSLIKTRASGQPAYLTSLSETIDFDLTVKNQGATTVYSVTVEDYLDVDGLLTWGTNAASTLIDGSVSNDHVVTFDAGVWTIDSLAPGETLTIPVELVGPDAITTDRIVNRAEITSFDDDANPGNTTPGWVFDFDSTPDDNAANDVTELGTGTFPEDSHNNIDFPPVHGINVDDEDDYDTEALEFGLMRIGSTVYIDADGDDRGDVGEGVEGVLVQLLDENDDVYAETVTNADGDYSFDQLLPGTYRVGIPSDQDGIGVNEDALVEHEPVPGDVSLPEFENFDNDGDAETGWLSLSDDVVLVYGDEAAENAGDKTRADVLTSPRTYATGNSNLDIDFVFELITYELGNLVWLDTGAGTNYNNGVANDDESGIEGVEVFLYRDNGEGAGDWNDGFLHPDELIDSTTTIAGGYYTFTGLIAADDYVVYIPTSELPLGYGTSGVPVLVGNETTADTDNNNNGVVYGATGWHSGPVSLGPVAWGEPTGEQDGTTGDPAEPTPSVADERANQTVDFGFIPSMRIGNQVWHDESDGDPTTQAPTDNNGVFDAGSGEVGLGGVWVELWIDDDPLDGPFNSAVDHLVDDATTDNEGNYWFDNVRPDLTYFAVVAYIGSVAGANPASSDGQSANPVSADNDDDGAPASGYIAASRAFTPTLGAASLAEADALEPGDGTGVDPDANAEVEANDLGPDYDDNDSELRIDFGFVDVPRYRLGNLVWLDNGGDAPNYLAANESNGWADPNEPGMPGVAVELYADDDGDAGPTASDTYLGFAITDSNGKYAFENLVAGDYWVRIDSTVNAAAVAGLTSTVDGGTANGDVDNDDNGVIGTGGWASSVISLNAANAYMGGEPTNEVLRRNETVSTDDDTGAAWSIPVVGQAAYNDNRSNFSIDFGFAQLYRIGNLVWNDVNNNGVHETGEDGIANVTVQLLDSSDAVVGTTVTDANGFYSFADLDAGDYSVRIPAPHDDVNPVLDVNLVLDGWFSSGTPVGTDNDDTDNDNNGVVGAGGWTSGTFTLGAANEPINETALFGGAGGDDDNDTFADNRSNYSVDFGFWVGLRLGNLVWHDESDTDPSTYELTDNNGAAEPFEAVIAGASVQLWRDLDDDGIFEPTGHDSAQTPLADVTDAEGNYLFTGLAPGSYFVAIVSLPTPAFDGFVPSGEVNADDNNNKGVSSTPGYRSVSQFQVVLESGSAGTGEIDVLPDNAADDGYTSAEDEADTAAGVDYRDIDSYLQYDFGFVEPPAYRIGNLVWQDDNRNGIAEAGEPGIVGVLVQLLNSGGTVIAETLTSGASPSQYGKYEFTQTQAGAPLAAGTYRVRIPADQTDSEFGLVATVGALDGLASTTDLVETNAGYSGVNDDDNNDDGVEIVDYWRSGVITLGPAESEPTDERLRNGSAIVDDADQLWTGGHGGTDARSNFTVDFGFYPGLRLGDFVWYDDGFNGTTYTYANENNGEFDAGELPVQGVTVQLFADTGVLGTFEPGIDDVTVLASTTTSATGYYYFTGLDEDVNYWVAIPATEQASTEPLEGWLSSDGQAADGNGTNNTDHGAPATGHAAVSPLIDLVRGGMNYGEGADETLADSTTGVVVPNANSNLVVDFGFKPEPRYELGNLVWLDDDNGIVDLGEVGISGVTVRLFGDNGTTPGVFESSDTEVATAVVTDGSGHYNFTDLPAGDYFVFIADQLAVQNLDLSLGRFDNVNPSLLAHDNDNNGHPVDVLGTTVGWVSSMTTLGDGADDHSEPALEEDANTELSAEDSPDLPPRDDRSDQTIDFGFSERARLGNLVWRDEADADPATEATTDNNGAYDQAAGEVPLAGVPVQLWHDTDGDGFEGAASDDVLVGETTSSVSGNYYFSRLIPGDGYYVAVPSVTGGSVLPAFDTPPGARSSAGQSATSEGADNDDDGAPVGAYASVSTEITLTVASESTDEQDGTDAAGAAETAANTAISRTYDDNDSQLRVDFGFIEVPLYRVGNLVWYDEDADARADLTELPIAGVRVDLYADDDGTPGASIGDTWMGATVTDAQGKYAFENLVAGDYYAVIPEDQSDDLGGTLAGLDQYALSNLVNSPGFSPVNNDIDNYDDGYPVSGVGVTTDVFTLGDVDPDAAIGTEPDDTSGALEREYLRYGSATDDDSGWANGPDNRSNFTVDFGFYQQLRLGNVVWLDDGNVTGGYDPAMEDNGIADAGEVGINGVTVALYTSDGLNGFDPGVGDQLVATTDTQTIGGVAGTYVFDNLNAGNYIVAIVGDESAFDELRLSKNPTGGPEDADDDNDGIASGTTDASLTTPVTYAWASDVITLAYGGEPTDEAGNFLEGTAGAAEAALNAHLDAANGATPYTRSDNFSQLRVDFGFSPVPLYSLGNLVWEDWNDNGIVDEDEPAIEGVTVELYLDGDEIGVDAPVATDDTDANGQYQFTDLPAGDYIVHIPAPHNDANDALDVNLAIQGWFTGGAPVATEDVDNDNNAVPDLTSGGWTSGVTTLGEGDDHSEPEGEEDANTETTAPVAPRDDRANQTVDFGFWRGLRLGNQVWLDEGAGNNQNNGVYDADETPIAGVTAELWLDDGDGTFDPLTDTWVADDITDGAGHYYFANVDEGEYFVAIESISGGGVQSSYNGPTPSLSVDGEDDGIATAGYLSVSPRYELTVGNAPTGEVDGPAATGGDAEATAYTATGFYPDENSYLTVDFGFINVPVYRIGNLVWNDYDNDGSAESGEPGIEGVRVELYQGDTLVDFVLTDEFGFYEFTNLMGGDYQVLIPAGQTVLDGLYGSVIADADGNNDEDNDSNAFEGTLDATDGWLSGIVTLGPNTAGGDPDVESVLETVRADDATDDDAGQAFSADPPAARIDDDRSNYTVDFGFYSITMGNLVFFDTDGDGAYEPGDGDDGIANVTVNLYAFDIVESEWNFVTSTTTDADGLYLFTGLVHGIEYLAEIPATQFAASAALDGLYSSIGDAGDVDSAVGDNLDRGIDPANHYQAVRSAGVTVESATEPEDESPNNNDETVTLDNSSNLLVDFGFYRLELGGVVWEDNGDGTDLTLSMKNNGVYEFEESPFANVEMLLFTRDSGGNIQPFLRADGTHASTTTDSDGNYRFTGLPAGQYNVVIPRAQFETGGALLGFVNSDGNDDALHGLQLAPLADNDDLVVDNGFPVLDEPGYPVAPSIFTVGPVRATELTLSPGVEPTSDGTPSTGYLDTMSNLTVDFSFWNSTIGLELGNQLWFDDDRDGIYDIGVEDPVPAGVVLYLYDVDAGEIIRTTVTDANGQYLFDELSAGRYRIGIADLNFNLGGLLHGYTATPVIAEDPDDEIDSDSNGLPLADKSIWSEVVTLVAAAPIDEIDPSSVGIDNRMSDLTVDFGLVEIVLSETGVSPNAGIFAALWMIVGGILLLLVVRRRRRES